MTTFDQISTCRKANRELWTEWARFYLALYREHRPHGGNEARWHRTSFRRAMRDRRQLRFFEAA